MQSYKVATLMRKDKAGPDMEFTAKDDLAACEIAHKFAKMHKALGYQVFRNSSRGWHNVCIDVFKNATKGN